MQDGKSPPAQTPSRKLVSRWKTHNRRRWAFEKDTLPIDERAPFVCECTSDDCVQAVELTMGKYEAAHLCPSWTAVLPGHLLPDDAGRLVLREEHFWVVEL